VHSGYARTVADGPAGGRLVRIRLRVRRFFCGNPDCAAVTFAEQAEGLTGRYLRRSLPLRGLLAQIGLVAAGRAGARLAAVLGVPVHHSTLLRLVAGLAEPGISAAPEVTGIDDFAFRKGRVYGTVLVDVATGTAVDLLPDRDAATVAAWLAAHPGAAVICRDRAGAYADAARQGAPDAVQVADRWHLYHNLAGHVEKTVARHRACLKDPQQPGPDPAQQRAAGSALARGVRERYEQVQTLRARGASIAAITRATGLAPQTVTRYCRSDSLAELLAVITDGPPSPLDAHKPYLNQRWNQGCTSARQLHTELRDRGYRGSYITVARYLQPFRHTAAPPATPAPPKTRDITRWILTNPAHLDDDTQAQLAQVTSRCPHLATLTSHVRSFAKMMTGRTGGQHLQNWLAAVDADDQPALHSFANGIRRDLPAVTNALTLPYSSGTVEGNVNKIKMIKRQMYGRASFALLRKRVILHPG
jgi:transposase